MLREGLGLADGLGGPAGAEGVGRTEMVKERLGTGMGMGMGLCDGTLLLCLVLVMSNSYF
jgi:F0F1-type ATP synthase membrane subunit c/vacuolar-type H+-ATPase subunit K